jgi:hypothetical protein
MDDPRKRPVVELRLVFADDSQDSRFWRMDDSPPKDFDQPEWMIEPRRSWQHPQDPIIFSCLVAEGREEEARDWLDAQGGFSAPSEGGQG